MNRFPLGSIRARALAGALLAAGTPLTQAQATGDNTVPIGQIVSSAPGLAEMGRELAAGAKACAAWANARGGVGGRSIQLVSGNDNGDPRTLDARAREMAAQHGIVALLTPTGREGLDALLAWAAREGLAVLGPLGSGALSSQAATLATAFMLRTHPSVEALRLSTQMQTIGIQRIAVVYGDDELGRETLATFEEALASNGLAAATVLPLRQGNAPAVVRELLGQAPQAVLLATTGPDTGSMLRALHTQRAGGSRITAYALSGAVSAQELLALGPAAQGLVLSQVLPSPDSTSAALARHYREAVREAGGGSTSYPGLEGCAAVLTLVQALRRSRDAPTRAAALKALRSAGEVDLGGWSVDLSDRRRPGSRFTDITLVGSDGRWVR